MGGAHILDSEERCQESDLQAFAIRDLKPVHSKDWGSRTTSENDRLGTNEPIEIVV